MESGRSLLTRADTDTLVESARSGDRRAFDELVRRTYRDTYTLALRIVGDPEDARDVTQDAYLRAYRGLESFRGDAQFTTWLYRITANRAATHLRRRIRHRHEPLGEEAWSVGDTTDAPASIERRLELSRALETLPPKLRAVVVLRDLYGFSHADIAQELSISESAAKVRLHRARRRLRDTLLQVAETQGSSQRAGLEVVRAM